MSSRLPPASWFRDRVKPPTKPRPKLIEPRTDGCPRCGGGVRLTDRGFVCDAACEEP